MSLESKAKTVYELMQKRKEWLEDFSAGALGNQEAYDRARENRPLYEQGVKYVPLEEAQKEITLAKDEAEMWKKNRNIYVEKKNKLYAQVEAANKILDEKIAAWNEAYSLEANDLQSRASDDLEEVKAILSQNQKENKPE
jgi:gas vesicle protein